MGMSLGVTVIAAIYHIAISVIDVDRTIAFHLDVLGMHLQVFTSADSGMAWQASVSGSQKIAIYDIASLYQPQAG